MQYVRKSRSKSAQNSAQFIQERLDTTTSRLQVNARQRRHTYGHKELDLLLLYSYFPLSVNILFAKYVMMFHFQKCGEHASASQRA